MTAKIDIAKRNSETFEVTVRAAAVTTHTVTLKRDCYRKLTHGKVSPETLIERAFEFLLKGESNTAIFSCFELPVVGRYLPQYENTIAQWL